MYLVAHDTASSGTGGIDILYGGHRLNCVQWYARVTDPAIAGLLSAILRWNDGTTDRNVTVGTISLLSTGQAQGTYVYETGNSQPAGTMEFALTSVLGTPEFTYTVTADVTTLP